MIANIKKDGTLEIKAETELEAYALNKWADDHFQIDVNCNKLLFNCNFYDFGQKDDND